MRTIEEILDDLDGSRFKEQQLLNELIKYVKKQEEEKEIHDCEFGRNNYK